MPPNKFKRQNMTPAEHARNAAISFECKKDALQQRQSGDWKISFTVQGVDMDERITRAAMGTRFVAVLVEIGDDELPQAAKETSTNSIPAPATPRHDPKSAGAKPEKRDWRDVQPAAQAGIRCSEPMFLAFLTERKGYRTANSDEAAEAVRSFCGVHSRVELGTRHAARMLWKQLDDEFQAWKVLERA